MGYIKKRELVKLGDIVVDISNHRDKNDIAKMNIKINELIDWCNKFGVI
jgi:hypothetical protein